MKYFHFFFDRNIFERIIIYIALSYFATTFVFELILGEASFGQTKNRQWVFYGFLALDYLISFRKVINIKFSLNACSLFALSLFIMIAHGLVVGAYNGNNTLTLLNDTIPMLMIALNILRMQSSEETSKEIDFHFILKSVAIITLTSAFFAVIIGNGAIGNGTIIIPLLLTALIYLKPKPKYLYLFAAIYGAIILTDLNRTTILFLILVFSLYLPFTLIKKPGLAISSILLLAVSLTSFFFILHEDTQTYRRITGIAHIDLNARKGSIGERQAEQDAVNEKLEKSGTTAQLIGLGFGAVYEFRSTHMYVKDYGHAHYSWVLFKLRYGHMGYLYLGIFALSLLYNGIQSFKSKEHIGYFIAFICLFCIIYLFTYVNAILLLSGLQFLHLKRKNRPRKPLI